MTGQHGEPSATRWWSHSQAPRFRVSTANALSRARRGFVDTSASLSGNFQFVSSLAPGSAPFVTDGSGVLAAFRCIDVFQLPMLPNQHPSLSRQIIQPPWIAIPPLTWSAASTIARCARGASSLALAFIAIIVIVASVHCPAAVSSSSKSAEVASAVSAVCLTSNATSAA